MGEPARSKALQRPGSELTVLCGSLMLARLKGIAAEDRGWNNRNCGMVVFIIFYNQMIEFNYKLH